MSWDHVLPSIALKKTLDTLLQANISGKTETALPDPELYIIVNGKPTKSIKLCGVVWSMLPISMQLYTN